MICPRCKDEILVKIKLIKGLKDMYVNAGPGGFSLGGVVTRSAPGLACQKCKLQIIGRG